MVDIAPGLDRFEARLVPTSMGGWTFRVEGWSDPYGTWAHDAEIKVEAGVDVELMLAEGALLLEQAAHGARAMPKDGARVLLDAVEALRDVRDTPHQEALGRALGRRCTRRSPGTRCATP